MIDPERLKNLLDGPASASLLRSQLAALDAYERLLSSGSLESGNLNSVMNDMIKATMDAQITLLKSTGELGDNLKSAQREWLSAYRKCLEAALNDQEPQDQS